MTIIQKPTPHHSVRPVGAPINCIIVHADASKSEASTIAWLADPASKVSYHYLIGRDGRVYQFVPDERKAWHAGVSVFNGQPDCNRYSIGVSFANDQVGERFPVVQVDAGVALCAMLCGRHGIELDRITTHAIVAPDRKKDPGPLFPWPQFLARIGAVLP
jgi:N-acetylmuramoyl-L-alanine amidase